ncbi:Zn-dependent protease with chaperone function [Catalinimonas alkaloidigena]|uniref:M56 family metallopeptidase n=1 Tax=Catalinimonas alkaloidigena TaxID=1075417 RepID=UPI0024060634|nr:M56 family metallopeptidase [Catalinimonas alkaloidigena]MDF9800748.1 Zn-dependent protease with chaperone function [Catalinimonas alkaloidigena]
MSSLFIYLLEASGVLLLLYALYWLLLRKETFFSLNRFFLLAIVVFSFLIPLLSFDLLTASASVVDNPIAKLRDVRIAYHDAFDIWTHESLGNASIREKTYSNPANTIQDKQTLFLNITYIVYGVGFAAVILRLIWSYCWILRLKNSSQKETVDGLTVVQVTHQIAPFSFLNSVFVHQAMLDSKDFDQVLAHEKTHIQQRHSLDLLIVQLAAALLWFNPVIWQLIKSLKGTHEYIADKKTIDQGYSLVTYQTLLLRQLISVNSHGLIHNFNLSFVKKRISMMTIEKSGWAGKAKVAMVLSASIIFSLVMMQCNTSMDDQVLTESSNSASLAGNNMDVPVLPTSAAGQFDWSRENTLKLRISDNKVLINEEPVAVEQIISVAKSLSAPDDVIVTQIDQNQSMGLVRKVQNELRKANRLKIIYLGQSSNGEQIAVPIFLPPAPEIEEEVGYRIPKITDEYAKEHNISMLKIQMQEDEAAADQQKVYAFAKEQIAQQNTNYVVSARFSDNDSYRDYLVSLYHLKEAFYQIYDERAQETYGIRFSEISQNRSASEEYQSMYDAIRQGLPMAISIAEN